MLPHVMPDALRPDRLARDDLVLLQRKALREWRESDWLAAHRPFAWRDLPEDDLVRVDLGGGTGESEQEPGYIVLDRDTSIGHDLRARSGETRLPDIVWDLHQGLPFEDETVDAFNVSFLVRDLPDHTVELLAKEIARTLKTAGKIHLHEDAVVLRRIEPRLRDLDFALEEQGPGDQFDSSSTRSITLVKGSGMTHDAAPLMVKEMVLGEVKIRAPRLPVPPS